MSLLKDCCGLYGLSIHWDDNEGAFILMSDASSSVPLAARLKNLTAKLILNGIKMKEVSHTSGITIVHLIGVSKLKEELIHEEAMAVERLYG